MIFLHVFSFQDVETASEPLGILIPEPANKLNSLLKPTLLAQSQQKEVWGIFIILDAYECFAHLGVFQERFLSISYYLAQRYHNDC